MSLASLLGWFDEHMRGGRSRLELRGPALPQDIEAVAAATGFDVCSFGWSLHDGQEIPTKKKPTIQGNPATLKIAWLPGGYRWLGAKEALTWALLKDNQCSPKDYTEPPSQPKRLPFATSALFFGASICVELVHPQPGCVMYRPTNRQFEPGIVLADSLDEFFATYLAHLQAGRIHYDGKKKRMAFCGGSIEAAFPGK